MTIPQQSKQEFITAIRQGMEALMNQCGYSRQRAIQTLLKELEQQDKDERHQQSRNASSHHRSITDAEIFDTMKRYRLGIEEAKQTLVIRNAFRQEFEKFATTNAGNDMIKQVIRRLVSKISMDKILYESAVTESDGDGTGLSVDGTALAPSSFLNIHRLRSSREPLPSTTAVAAEEENSTTAKEQAGIIVTKKSNDTTISSSSRKMARKNKASSSSSTRKANNVVSNTANTDGGSAPTGKNKSLSGRKRTVDEMITTPSTSVINKQTAINSGTPANRPRADSVTEVVDAKLMNESRNSTANGALVASTANTSVPPRAKRVHRATATRRESNDDDDVMASTSTVNATSAHSAG
mmetsp:Transcript_2143/g.3865  ORF Transcript_2143/g.3865 Transcript_2143/m.3865 type:complete len:353 (-) Transcript_2143:251-1309(-)